MRRQHCGDRMQTNTGQVAILVAVFFMLISAVVSSAVVALGVSQLKVANEFVLGKKSFATAESGIEDVALRVADLATYAYNGPSPAPDEIITLAGQGSATVNVNNTSGYTLTTTGNVSQRFRKLTAKFTVANAAGFGFPAAITVGYLGTILNNSVQIQNADHPARVGNVWSNGTVSAAGSGDFVTGDVKVSRPIAGVADSDDSFAQVQTQVDPGLNNIILMRSSAASRDVVMSFIADKTAYVTEIWLKIDRSVLGLSNYPAMNVKILPNEKWMDRPLNLGSTISYRAFDASGVTYKATQELPSVWTKIRLNVNRTVYENERYWIVLDNSGTAYASYYRLYGADGTAPATRYTPQRSCYKSSWCNTSDATRAELDDDATVGHAKTSADWDASSPVWTPSNTDIAFKVIFGEPTYVTQSDPFNTSNPYTTKAKEANTGKDIIADTIENSNAAGKVYYNRSLVGTVTAGGSNCPNSNCVSGTVFEPFKIVDVFSTELDKYWQKKVAEWISTADSGTHYDVSQSVGNGDKFRINDTGPATINGDLTVTGDGKVYVDDILVVNGKMDLNNTCEIHNKNANHRGFIIVSGKVTSDNSCKYIGNGSNIFIISTYYNPTSAVNSEPENTISFGNNSNGQDIDVVLFAPFGEIRIANSAQVTAMSAAKITAQNSGTIKYKDVLVNPQEPGADLSRVPTFSAYYESQ